MVLLPISALVAKSTEGGMGNFWDQVSSPQAVSALKLTLICSLIVVVINAVMGTMIAWVLVRDEFRGKSLLKTIVASLVLITLYGNNSPVGIHLAFTKPAVVLALCFVTLPFVVRSVQPVLLELDIEVEEAAASLGASGFTIFRRIIFPNLLPGLLSGVALAFARALGEYGSLVLIAASFNTQVSSVFIRTQVENGNYTGAAAVSIVLLLLSLVMLTALNLVQRWGSKHDR
jgi:sulfate/thiosulfate transport system permease protein